MDFHSDIEAGNGAAIETVLVTGAGGPAGSSLVNQLKGRGLRVVATDIVHDPTVAQRADYFVVGPRADDFGLIPFLLGLCDDPTLRIDVFIPTVQDELLQVAAAAPAFPCQVMISPAHAVGLANDKLLTATFAERAGLPVPRTVSGAFDADRWGEEMGLPVVAKPRVSRGGRGVRVLESLDSAEADAVDAGDIVQQFAEGVEYCPQLYRSPVTGEFTSIVLVKTKLKQGCVGNAESVARVEDIDESTEISALGAHIMEAFGLVGAVDMDIRRMGDGRPVLLEINARFGANSATAPEILDAVLGDVARGAFASSPALGVVAAS